MLNFKHGTNSRILPCSKVSQDWIQHPAGSDTEPSGTSTSKPGAANPLQVQQVIPARAQQSQEAPNPLHIPSLDVWNISQCHHRHLGTLNRESCWDLCSSHRQGDPRAVGRGSRQGSVQGRFSLLHCSREVASS